MQPSMERCWFQRQQTEIHWGRSQAVAVSESSSGSCLRLQHEVESTQLEPKESLALAFLLWVISKKTHLPLLSTRDQRSKAIHVWQLLSAMWLLYVPVSSRPQFERRATKMVPGNDRCGQEFPPLLWEQSEAKLCLQGLLDVTDSICTYHPE